MKINFTLLSLSDITDMLTQHLTSYPSPVESFFEEHVEQSNHYHIYIDGAHAGFTSIHDRSLVTQFCLFDTFKQYGQPVFQHIKKLENIRRAFVPTCDEFFLSHALDEHRLLEMQAYFFQTCAKNVTDVIDLNDFSFRLADKNDIELIRQASDDFFDPIEEAVEKGELFITYKGHSCAGFGVANKSKFCSGLAAIGMFTNKEFRNQGVGTATIRFLMQECQQNGLRAVAGCGYYNHLSKRTLEKAGMYTQTRLLKVSY